MEKKKLTVVFILGLIIIAILYNSYNNKISDYEDKISSYESQIYNYKSKISNYESEIEKLNTKVEDAQTWFDMDEEEQKEIIDKQEAKRKAQEEQEKKEQEEAEKKEQEKKEQEQQDNEDYEFDYHYDSDKPTNLGDGLSISKCPYCGGRYVNDINDGSSYCMDCGIGIEE